MKEVSRLEEILNRVLSSFKRIRLQTVPSDINEILTKVLKQLHHHFHHTGIQLTTNMSRTIPEIELDRYLIEESLRSIVETMIRGMAAGSELTISTTLNHRHVVIEINGNSLNPKPLNDCQLFFPFYREPALDGGVGIPLSQQIISQHGGNVVIKNGCDQQVTLIITLPVPRTRHRT